MQQFVVPQFIDVEDKIFGPLSVRQFVMMMGGALLLFLEYRLASFTLFVLEGLVTLGFVGIFAFAKVNGMPFHYFLINLIASVKRPRIRVWQAAIDDADLREGMEQPVVVAKSAPASHRPALQRSRLTELTLVVDTGGAYTPEEGFNVKPKNQNEKWQS